MRLIDADALIKHIKDLPTWWLDEGGFHSSLNGMYDPQDVISSIENAPTIDAAEVVHGRWIVGGNCNHVPHRIKNPEKWVLYKCSECGYSNGRKQSNYCPNCGARMMDGIEHGNDL